MDTALQLADEQRSVEALYRADADRLWGAIYTFSGDSDIANDAVAEAFAQLLPRGAAVRDPAAWVWSTAFRIARGQLKDRSRSISAVMSQTPPAASDRYGDPDLMAAVGRLPEAQRAVVVLFYYADLPVRDIARRLATNPLAVRANLSRGRRRLRKLLGDDRG